MVLVKSKKGAVEYLVEFVFAVIILAIVLILITLAAVLGVISTYNIDATVDEYSSSAVCDTYLLNFIRAKDSETNLTFAELAALAEDNFIFRDKFSEQTTEFFNKTYLRGNPNKQKWKIQLKSMERLTVAEAGNLQTLEIADTCSQNIPSKKPGKFLILTLGLEY